MDLKDPKALKKLAEACRQAGIQNFKGFGVEFTLGPAPQPKVAKSQSKQTASHYEQNPMTQGSKPNTVMVPGPNGPVEVALPKEMHTQAEIETDTPTREELLFWSISDEQEAS